LRETKKQKKKNYEVLEIRWKQIINYFHSFETEEISNEIKNFRY
jgi:hypothetical protein